MTENTATPAPKNIVQKVVENKWTKRVAIGAAAGLLGLLTIRSMNHQMHLIALAQHTGFTTPEL